MNLEKMREIDPEAAAIYEEKFNNSDCLEAVLGVYPFRKRTDEEFMAADWIDEIIAEKQLNITQEEIDRIISTGKMAIPMLEEFILEDVHWEAAEKGNGWSPLLALAMLGCIGTEDIFPTLEVLIKNEFDYEELSEYIPIILGSMELKAIPFIRRILMDRKIDNHKRFYMAEALSMMARRNPETMDQVHSVFMDFFKQAEDEEENHWDLGLVVGCASATGDARFIPVINSIYDRDLINELTISRKEAMDYLEGRVKDDDKIKDPRQLLLPDHLEKLKEIDENWWDEIEKEKLLPKVAHSSDDEGTYTRETPKVGRNDPCPCGSGKKYKKCCLNKEN